MPYKVDNLARVIPTTLLIISRVLILISIITLITLITKLYIYLRLLPKSIYLSIGTSIKESFNYLSLLFVLVFLLLLLIVKILVASQVSITYITLYYILRETKWIYYFD